MLCVAAFVAGSSLLVAACGGSGSGAASASGSTTSTVAGGAAAQTAFRDCLKKQGVTLPAGFGDRGPGSRPGGGSGPAGGPPGGFAGGSGAPGGRFGGFAGGAGGQKFQKAFQACRGTLPAGGFRGGRGGDPQALQAYLSCLRDHGVNVPAFTRPSTPPAGGSGPVGPNGRGQSALRAVRNDPKFAAANKTCRPLLPTFAGGSTTSTTTAS